MNNKGFIATSILYGIVAMLFACFMFVLANSRLQTLHNRQMAQMVKNDIDSSSSYYSRYSIENVDEDGFDVFLYGVKSVYGVANIQFGVTNFPYDKSIMPTKTIDKINEFNLTKTGFDGTEISDGVWYYHIDLFDYNLTEEYTTTDFKFELYMTSSDEKNRMQQFKLTDVNYTYNQIKFKTIYTLTYNNNGGSGCTSTTGKEGFKWNANCTPHRSGYTFDGWGGIPPRINGDVTVNAMWIKNVNDYNSKKGVYRYNVPITGKYKLEIWGGQGAYALVNNKPSGQGGYGAYSVGYVNLNKNASIYIVVGGKGADPVAMVHSDGGYNGGGLGTSDNSDDETSGGGGGATHIATNDRGVLANYRDYTNEILLVAGGGGGASNKRAGGSAGGTQGLLGENSGITTVATQDSGYAFGLGESGPTDKKTYNGVAGAGGGWYGGYTFLSSINGDSKSAGGGGSGYVGAVSDGLMFCYNCLENAVTVNSNGSSDLLDKTNCPDGYSEEPISKCAKAGEGHARITYMGS